MSTRALIAAREGEGLFSAVYLHYDGYPDHAGSVLQKFHNSEDKARQLCAGVDIRCLDDGTGRPERFSDGRPPARANGFDSLIRIASKYGCSYLYVFEDGHWSVHRV